MEKCTTYTYFFELPIERKEENLVFMLRSSLQQFLERFVVHIMPTVGQKSD